MSYKELCLNLATCETEEEVITQLKDNGMWDNPENWMFFGDNENNYSTIGNQQAKPEAALVEKIINSVDAMLMAECLKRGIKPDSENAPKSIIDALMAFYNIKEGKLTNITPSERSKLAQNICIVSTGAKAKPNYTIIDMGEGQTPNNLPKTLLSLAKSNKLRIPFVQGKFNMGGTGVFRFCGTHNVQLIISRRNLEISKTEIDSTKDFWGFTVIRREDPSKGVRSSSYKYLAPGGHILFFGADELNLLPGNYPEAHSEPMRWGTFIKLFEYEIGPSYKTNIIFDLNYRLSLLMPQLALPVRLFERREGYTGHSREATLSGLSVRIDEDRSDNIEDGYPSTGFLNVSGQKMSYSIYAFKKDLSDGKNRSEKYTKDEGILFTVNGQTHGHLSKTFFTRKSVNLGYIADSVLVLLDCSDINGRAREDLFMNNRTTLSNCHLKSDIEVALQELLKNHPGLKALKEQRRKEEIEEKLKDSKPLVDVLENVLRKSPTLSKLFLPGGRLSNPFDAHSNDDGKSKFIGKEFPSFFTLIKQFDANSPKQAHIKSRFRIQFKTDVRNDYFDRSKDPGTFRLFLNGKEQDDVSIMLWNGIATLNVLLERFKEGELLQFRSEVTDISLMTPFMDEFYVKAIPPISQNPKGKAGKRKSTSNTDKGNETPTGLALPNIIQVKRDEWSHHGFDERSALKVMEDNGFDFYINIDNIYLLNEMKSGKSVDASLIQKKYEFGLVLVGLSLINGFNQNNKGSVEDDFDYLTEIKKISSYISPILIPMMDSIGALEVDESV